jgi:hypothetical protein
VRQRWSKGELSSADFSEAVEKVRVAVWRTQSHALTRTPQIYRVDLLPGQTLIIPQVRRTGAADAPLTRTCQGWIHSVYTPEDSVVFGGNFLHWMGAPMQILVHKMEVRSGQVGIPAVVCVRHDCSASRAQGRCGVGTTFRFPYFRQINWFAARSAVMRMRKGVCMRRGGLPRMLM